MSLVNSLAKIYDHKTLKKHTPSMAATLGKRPTETDKPPVRGFNLMETRIESLSDKMDKLINIQETVLSRLDGMSQDMETIMGDKEEAQSEAGVGAEVTGICQEMSTIMSAVNQRSEQQAQKLEGMERLVLGIQQVIGFIGETVKSSRLMELVFNRPPAARQEEKLAKPTAREKPGKTAAKEKPPKSATKEKPPKSATKETPPKSSTKEKLTKPAAKEKLAKPAAKEKPPKSTTKEKPAKPEGKAKQKRQSLISKLRDLKGRDGKERSCLSLKGLKSQKKKKPPDTADTISLKKQVLLLEEVQKLNQQNAEKSGRLVTPEAQDSGAGERGQGELLELILDVPRESGAEQQPSEEPEAHEPTKMAAAQHEEEQEEEAGAFTESEEETEEEVEEERLKTDEAEEIKAEEEDEEQGEEEEAEEEERDEGPTETEEPVPGPDNTSISPVILESFEEEGGATCSEGGATCSEGGATCSEGGATCSEGGASSKRRVTEEHRPQDDHKKSRVEEERKEEGEGESAESKDQDASASVETGAGPEKEEEELSPEEYIIDSSPPPLAPFDHRIVLAKPNQISSFYTINREEIIGGGRFGQVHKCVENSSGLTLAAKIIKARSPKEKDVVRNEIQVMNQLSHANLIQLYAAYESRTEIILVMEYVDGGELFDRIIDENYTLTELDTVLFMRQITEGLQYMHQMYILHLDLKPENILCVSRATNKVKIIDFGLARRYKPREKLRVNFGTPEFLAPEVINYEYVSFPTDMWSLGVITYMLLSGLSPFLGEDDNETLNNILACQWNFEEEEFTNVSEEAKDFITRLLVQSKSWRMSASESLRHPWLSDRVLHSRLHQKKSKCHSTHTPPPKS